MFGFIMRFGQVNATLTDLLEMKFIPDESQDEMEQFLHNISGNILQAHNNGNYEVRDYELLRLQMFAKHLQEVGETRPDLLEEFASEMHDIGYNEYFGTRFEIDTCASLVRNEVDFEHPDPPDFIIERVSGEIAIECTTSHYSGSSQTLEDKYKSTIDSKSGKSYYESSTALFVDITNLYYHGVDRQEPLSREKIIEWTRERIELFDLDIGSVLLFSYIVDRDDGGMHHAYNRFDTDNAADPLIDFLDEFYPSDDGFDVDRAYHPHES
ncbi:hypothetical protein [Halolamina salifodinae]|uniref:Restriction endonuclease n=1 Tax=Halolamina salifodinae TaxID=1202767 RepID=A0A8T4GSF1_9EURY|nr:hypothetical protein [Halolamina salifodinae]MBP1985967.1 hypothetical protein [Halolamina salifodinae]